MLASFKGLLPEGVSFSRTEYQVDVQINEAEIPPQLSEAVQRRKAAYVAGRASARAALLAAGAATGEVGYGEKNAPNWPQGWVGSITHTETSENQGVAAAAVGSLGAHRSIGIDSEQWASLETAREIREQVAVPEEMEILSFLKEEQALTVLFSAKEAIYKAVAPLVGVFFDFEDARLAAASKGAVLELTFELVNSLDREFTRGTLVRAKVATRVAGVDAAVVI